MNFDSFDVDIQSDEFATEWEDFVAALDEAMIQHIEEENP